MGDKHRILRRCHTFLFSYCQIYSEDGHPIPARLLISRHGRSFLCLDLCSPGIQQSKDKRSKGTQNKEGAELLSYLFLFVIVVVLGFERCLLFLSETRKKSNGRLFNLCPNNIFM